MLLASLLGLVPATAAGWFSFLMKGIPLIAGSVDGSDKTECDAEAVAVAVEDVLLIFPSMRNPELMTA